MSDFVITKIKVLRPKHIKGNTSMETQDFTFPYNNNINSYSNSKKSNRAKTNSKPNKSERKANNNSFILRRKNHNDLDDINIKMITHKTISKDKKLENSQPRHYLKVERKNPFHARIRSLQINYKDKNNLYSIHNYNKTDVSNYKDKKIILNSKNKINNINQKYYGENNYNDYSSNKNKIIVMKKNNSLLEDNESTKYTKLSEPKSLNYENNNNNFGDNKLLIIDKKNKNIKYNDIIEKKKLKHSVLKNENIKSNCNRNKNRVIIKTKFDNLKKINSTNRDEENRDNSPLLKTEEKNNISASNIVQKIKEKIHLLKTAMEDNYNSARSKANKDITYNNNSTNSNNKNSTNSNNNNSINNNSNINSSNNNNINNYKFTEVNSIKGKKSNNNNYSKFEKKMNFPINLKKSSNKKKNIFIELDKHFNSTIKNKSNISKNKKKVYNKYNRNKKRYSNEKYNLNNKSISNFLHDDNSSFRQVKKKLHFKGTRSQRELMPNFIEKTLNSDETKNKPKIIKRKNPKDLSEKTIEKIETICQKGFFGVDVEKTNQDNFFIYKNFINNPNYIFFGVCDGHGTFGHEVSGYLVYDIPLKINDLLIKKNIKKICESNISKITPLIKNTFIQIDKNISKKTKIDITFSGSTCVSLIYTPSKLLCANVGDSRCIIGKFDEKNWFPKSLSFDHKPENKLEKERILNNGGRIEPYVDDNGEYYGPQRVWLKNGDVPGLAMSRSFGDMVAHSVGVSCEPEIIEYSFLEEDKFIILASDGIWEFISNKECVDIVKDYYIQKDINGAINYLYKEATKRWIIKEEIIDDITLIIIFLK